VRYLHYSLMVFGHARIPIISWMRNQATEGILPSTSANWSDHDPVTLREYYNLLALVVDKSVWLEEYAREQITLEEQHMRSIK
jgi:bacterioferritin